MNIRLTYRFRLQIYDEISTLHRYISKKIVKPQKKRLKSWFFSRKIPNFADNIIT